MVPKKTETPLDVVLREMDVPRQVSRGIEKAGGTRSLESKMPRSNRVKAMVRHHKALSDEIRLRLLFALAMTDMCPCLLKTISGTNDSKLSYHLKLLETEGLIVAKRVKNWRIYSITEIGRKSISMHKR